MERLTYKNYIEEYEVNFEKGSDKNWSIAESDTHIKVTGEPIEKLGELEDMLESWHIENLEELKTRLHDCQVYHLKNNSNETLIHNLKNELAEFKQKAIVPKFKTGDKVYGIIDTWAYTGVFPVEIRGNHLLYEVWDGEDTTKQHSTRIFETKEEAEAKLEELGEKK